MDVRIYDIEKTVANKVEEMEFVGSYPDFVMYENLEFGGFIEINNNVYRMCMYSPNEDTLAVEKCTRFEAKPKAIEANDFTCPFCKAVDHDAWELPDDEGNDYCGSCGSDLKYIRIRSVFGDSDFKYKVAPLEMSPYTKLN